MAKFLMLGKYSQEALKGISAERTKKVENAIKKAGGKVIGEKPDDIPNVGIFMRCEDTEGNVFALLQPAPGDWMPKK